FLLSLFLVELRLLLRDLGVALRGGLLRVLVDLLLALGLLGLALLAHLGRFGLLLTRLVERFLFLRRQRPRRLRDRRRHRRRRHRVAVDDGARARRQRLHRLRGGRRAGLDRRGRRRRGRHRLRHGLRRRLHRRGAAAVGERLRRRLERLLLRQRRHERLAEARQVRRHAGRVVRQNLRRDHHHELGAILLRRLALEQETENRNVADARHLLQRLVHLAVDQPRDRERL